MQLVDKIAVVTGSGRGIGRSIALRLAQDGADVVVNYLRNREPAQETASAISDLGRRAHVVKANVGDPADLDRLVEETVAHFGGIDILVNNAASGYIRPIATQRVKGWDWTMDINARAALFLGQKAAPHMAARGGGAIVNISSLGSQRVMPDYVVIGASKAALEAVTRYMGVEMRPDGIVVNAVSGGLVDTDALKHFPHREKMIATATERTPAGRMVAPDDVAAAVAFLCTPAAAMIVGQTLVVDGGYSLVA